MFKKTTTALIIIIVIITQATSQSSNLPVYKDSENGIETRVKDLLSQMTLEEKIDLLSGAKNVENNTNTNPGESKMLSFNINKNDLAFYDVKSKQWVAEPGRFRVLIGSSSRDIRLKGDFELK